MCDYKKIFKDVLIQNNNHSKWNSGDYKDIKLLANTKVGDVGEGFIVKVCEELGIPYEFPLNKKGEHSRTSPWDIKINGITFELKTATEDIHESFQFNHIRYHRKYEAVLCLGVSPNSLQFNLWSKADITTGKAGNLVSMEKGANASYKLTKKKNALFDITEFEIRIKEFKL
ncbi:hypothetical protein N5U14_10925 [Aliarcobacter butzleri]|uniref:hypothetical protein n=1 Tax=Aliarcobacter butzleri TaxID=28197 RepID=UPI0021B351EF|nr:hypothetical protein [Aliarcobacter butzleri]MCT7611350.1 hypothetical protein [Aliarcobacter butzleri]